MRILRPACARAGAMLVSIAAFAQGTISDLPRKETIILENPEGTIKNAGWFNIWAINAGGQSTGLHQLALDTFWYIDPDRGHRRRLGQLAGRREADLQRRLHRDDGEAAPGHLLERRRRVHRRRRGLHGRDPYQDRGLRWSAPVQINVDERHGARPAHRGLQAEEAELALPRAVHRALERDVDHAQACLREGGRPAAVRLQPAGLARRRTCCTATIPNGKWYIWQKRDDWQRTTLARFGEPGPKYVAYIDPGPAGQARDRAAQPPARHHPRRGARGHVHARQAVADARTAGSRASPTPTPTRPCRR